MLTIIPTSLPGVSIIERRPITDERGYFERVFCSEELRDAGWPSPVAQINHTYTAKRGGVRGLHFQHPPHAEVKIVTCLRGHVFDVALDLRRGSATFLKSVAVELSAGVPRSLLIPEGFAHGFQTLSDDAELLYFHSAPHAAAAADGVNPFEPRAAIAWPLEVAALSDNDRNRPMLTADYEGITL